MVSGRLCGIKGLEEGGWVGIGEGKVRNEKEANEKEMVVRRPALPTSCGEWRRAKLTAKEQNYSVRKREGRVEERGKKRINATGKKGKWAQGKGRGGGEKYDSFWSDDEYDGC